MSLSSEEAVASLTQVEEAGRRSSQLYFYHCSSPHLIMWGIIWVIGYGGTGFFPHQSLKLWLALMVAGIVGGTLIRRKYGAKTSDAPYAWRFAALWVIILFFVFATYAILRPTHGNQFCAFPALVTGCAYMAIGLWQGLRYLIAGAAVVALTLAGYFYIEQFFLNSLWFAVVGGGAMILTGLWFRTA